LRYIAARSPKYSGRLRSPGAANGDGEDAEITAPTELANRLREIQDAERLLVVECRRARRIPPTRGLRRVIVYLRYSDSTRSSSSCISDRPSVVREWSSAPCR
jgi:hypothetical protein